MCGICHASTADMTRQNQQNSALQIVGDVAGGSPEILVKEHLKERVMKLTEEQRKEFEAVSRPLIKFLNDNFHPHVTVVVDPTSAELSEGSCSFVTHEYVRD